MDFKHDVAEPVDGAVEAGVEEASKDEVECMGEGVTMLVDSDAVEDVVEAATDEIVVAVIVVVTAANCGP